MLQRGPSYEAVYRGFRWQVPARFNIGTACCDRHATGDGRMALIYEAPDGTVDSRQRYQQRNPQADHQFERGRRRGDVLLIPDRHCRVVGDGDDVVDGNRHGG